MRAIQAAAVLCALALWAPSPSSAATYYVDPGGSNSNPGTQAQPWSTPQYAANQIGPGDTVLVNDGNYGPFHVTTSGTPAQRVVFRSTNRHGAVISGSESHGGHVASIGVHFADYVTIDGFKVLPGGHNGQFERGIRCTGWRPPDENLGCEIRNNLVLGSGTIGIGSDFARGVIIEDNEVGNSEEQHGIYVANSADFPIVRRNVIYGNGRAGVHMNGDGEQSGDGIIRGALVEDNIMYDNGQGDSAATISMDGVADSIVRNNLLFNNHGQGITAYRIDGSEPSTNNKILNNTVIMAADGLPAMRFVDGATGGVLKNNILIHLGSRAALEIDPDSYSGLVSDNNIISRIDDVSGGCCIDLNTWRQRHPEQDANSFAAPSLSALFLDSGNDDYHLKAGSIALDAGATLADVLRDLEGSLRPQGAAFDIGAYEMGGGVVQGPPPTVGNVQRTDVHP